jgi:hypothetical protein
MAQPSNTAHFSLGLTAIEVMFAIAVTRPAVAADSTPEAKGTQAEVQIGLCSPPDQIVQALRAHSRGQPIQVWQFDDATLSLFERGLRLRLRVAASGHSEFTLKVAHQDCARLDRRLVPPGEGKCEYDVYDTGSARAVSLTRALNPKETNDLVSGSVQPAQVLSQSQLRYLREVVGIRLLPAGIRPIGPMRLQTYRTEHPSYDIDISQLPGGERYAEISRKVPLRDATQAMDALKAHLSRAGVELCADQSSQAANKLRALLRQR